VVFSKIFRKIKNDNGKKFPKYIFFAISYTNFIFDLSFASVICVVMPNVLLLLFSIFFMGIILLVLIVLTLFYCCVG
jgi:hypothetical protein